MAGALRIDAPGDVVVAPRCEKPGIAFLHGGIERARLENSLMDIAGDIKPLEHVKAAAHDDQVGAAAYVIAM